MNSAAITHDVFYPYPPERVWRALTTSAAVAQWLMPNDFAPVVGHQFTFTTAPMPAFGFDGIVHCQVTACDEPRLLRYTWNGGQLRSVVTYALEPEGDGTRLHFEHSGFDLGNPADAGAYRGMQGWHAGLDESLPRAIEALGAA
ncbi:MAG: SRPBCC domain-containing protein [Chloroflexota bacterium]|nr:SRPBCC domain-containing protein [Chloroflexota bacterium]